jgi:hypothetical protein
MTLKQLASAGCTDAYLSQPVTAPTLHHDLEELSLQVKVVDFFLEPEIERMMGLRRERVDIRLNEDAKIQMLVGVSGINECNLLHN